MDILELKKIIEKQLENVKRMQSEKGVILSDKDEEYWLGKFCAFSYLLCVLNEGLEGRSASD